MTSSSRNMLLVDHNQDEETLFCFGKVDQGTMSQISPTHCRQPRPRSVVQHGVACAPDSERTRIHTSYYLATLYKVQVRTYLCQHTACITL